MRRTTWKQIGLTAVAALVAAGCASPAPQRSPGGTGGTTVQGSTAGDLDACAAALGNATGTAGGATGTAGTNAGAPAEVTANGVLVGNVALVALPTHDNMPSTSTGGGPTGTTAAPGSTAAPGTPGTAAPSTTGTTAVPTPAGRPVGTTGGPNGLPGAAIGAGTAGNTNATALERIRGNCRGLTEIRIVTAANDRTRLAQVAMAMRKGVPVTEYIDDIAKISRRATIAGGASGAGTSGSGGGGAPTPAPGRLGTPPRR